MTTGLTVLYYTDNKLPQRFGNAHIDHLAATAERLSAPIVSVSQQPMSLGRNVCVGPQPRAYRSIVHQIVIGLDVVTTDFVALCEHDTFYPPSHCLLRPPEGFDLVWNQHRHRAFPREGRFCLFRGGRSMNLIVGRTGVLRRDLAGKLSRLVADADWHGKFEPGKGEAELGLPPVRGYVGASAEPIIDIVNHGRNAGGKKRVGDMSTDRLPDGRTMADLDAAWHVCDLLKGSAYPKVSYMNA